ncbi:MAG: tetratricopeptide repeat protein [Candidatus Krumholzibacteriota bacterium]|nr:tetratricopeptide repeat protein [Candidatus Krumholzibacteriota bacterium]
MLLCFLLAFVTLGTAAAEAAARPPGLSLPAVDSLFAAGRYDTVAAAIPGMLETARSSGDSAAVVHLLVLQGRMELAWDARRAEATLEAARLTAEAAGDTAGWSDALGFKSIATAFLGRYEESVELNGKRLALCVRSGDLAGEAWARTGLGYVYLKTGRFEEAESEYARAAGVFERGGRTHEQLIALVGLGRALNARKRPDAARDVYRRVLETSIEIDDTARRSEALNNLGNLEYHYGDMAVAAQYLQRAYELNLSIGDGRGAIVPATNVALAKSYLGQYSDAAAILLEALERCETRGYRDLAGMVLCTLGQVRLSQGRTNESARIYRRALALGEGLSRKQRDDAAYGLARALASSGKADSAAAVLVDALDNGMLAEFEPGMGQYLSRCLRRLGRNEEALARALAAVDAARRTGSLEDRFLTSLELCAAYRATGDPRESRDWYLRSVDTLEDFRLSTGALEWREAHGRIRDLVDVGRVLLEYPPEDSFETRAAALFDLLQRFKARTLAERMTARGQRRTENEEAGPVQTIRLSALMEEVLQPGDLFVDFAVGDSVTFLFAVDSRSFRLVELPGRDSGLAEKISFFLEGLDRPPGSDGGVDISAEETARIGASVSRLLLGEVDNMVHSAKRILISPDSYLSAVPFGVLPAPGPDRARLLMDAYEIEYLPSATVLALLRDRPAGRGDRASAGGIVALLPAGDAGMKGAAKEVSTIARMLEGVTIREGKPDLDSLGAGTDGFEVFHVAAHFVANNEKPWFSGILLGAGPREAAGPSGTGVGSGEGAGVPVDPYLRAKDIAARTIPAKLAVLSGCESALGRASSGEGVLGLTSAFLSAGVPVVVSTSWPVDDDVTATLMSAFYRGLAAGSPVSIALTFAKKEIRSDPRTSHPFYWAGFVVVGDGSLAVDIRPSDPRLPVPVLTVILFMLSVIVLVWFKLDASRRESGGQV